ncbi:MAG: adenosine deaminase [Deltaproteobacteria bacterium RIFOXYB12_FULL_58_9]|nr:MAG: adenosine deaminase [Deltaproteobacteria bacterium RIFOXYB12_FULL_58_9]
MLEPEFWSRVMGLKAVTSGIVVANDSTKPRSKTEKTGSKPPPPAANTLPDVDVFQSRSVPNIFAQVPVGDLYRKTNDAALLRFLDEAIAYAHLAPLSSLDDAKLAIYTKSLPKVELHQHLDGSIDPETLIEFARQRGIDLPADTIETLSRPAQKANGRSTLKDFFERFRSAQVVWKDRDAIKTLTVHVIEKAAHDNVKHLELQFSPVGMAECHGLDLEDVVKGVIDGVAAATEQFAIGVRLIVTISRRRSVALGWEVEKLAAKYKDRGVVALGLASDEKAYPADEFAPMFQAAEKDGLGRAPHSGEDGPATNVATAIKKLKANRIGHGIRVIFDPEGLELVRTEDIPLEICPSSNILTGAAESWAKHPFRVLLDAGVRVTINTDDPGLFGVTLSDEMALAAKHFDLSCKELRTIISNSVDAAFLEGRDKQKLRLQVLTGISEANRALVDNLTLRELLLLAIGGMRREGMPVDQQRKFVDDFMRHLEAAAEENAAAKEDAATLLA